MIHAKMKLSLAGTSKDLVDTKWVRAPRHSETPLLSPLVPVPTCEFCFILSSISLDLFQVRHLISQKFTLVIETSLS